MIAKGLLGALLVGCWIGLFIVGLLVPSKIQREELLAGRDLDVNTISYVAVTWTPINVAFLALVAGLVGGVGRAVFIDENDCPEKKNRTRRERETIFAGVIKGFLIYLTMLAGVFIFTNQPFADTTPEQYARVAGTVSLFAFLSALQPAFFQKIISAVATVGEKD